MYKRVRIKKLGRKKTHRESLINNQLRSIFKTGYIKTTSVKAKSLKTNVEKLLSSYSDNLSFRRKLINILGTKELVNNFYTYAKKDNKGVRIIKLGFRPGDMTEMSKVTLINFAEKKVKKEEIKDEDKGEKKDKKAKKKTNTSGFDNKKLEMKSEKMSKPQKVVVNKERAKSRSGL